MATGTKIEADENVVLARFPGRRDKLTGQPQELRLTRANWNGRIYVHLRLWYSARKPTRHDDGFRPTKVGVMIREDELDQTIAALIETARLVKAEGRPTSIPAEGEERNPRAQSRAAKRREEQGKPPLGRSAYDKAKAHRAELDKGGAAPELPSGGNGQPSLVDDLAEYRR